MTILNSDGQVTIPSDLINKLGIKVGNKLFFVEIDGKSIILSNDPNQLDMIQNQLKGKTKSYDPDDGYDYDDIQGNLQRN